MLLVRQAAAAEAGDAARVASSRAAVAEAAAAAAREAAAAAGAALVDSGSRLEALQRRAQALEAEKVRRGGCGLCKNAAAADQHTSDGPSERRGGCVVSAGSGGVVWTATSLVARQLAGLHVALFMVVIVSAGGGSQASAEERLAATLAREERAAAEWEAARAELQEKQWDADERVRRLRP